MPWYRVGTVAVTLNSNAVTGNGTAFIANSRVGDAFIGPDGKQYEVTNIASNTALSIAPPYGSTSTGAGAYALMPVQGYTKDLADQARAMIQQWGATLAGLGAVSTEDVVPVSKGGTGGTNQETARNALGLGSAAVAPIVGTVSQSGGAPTGAIMEFGSNANGTYTKFADGTMFCKISLPTIVNLAANQIKDFGQIVLPAAFVNVQYSVLATATPVLTFDAYGFTTAYAVSTNFYRLIYRNGATAQTLSDTQVTCVGRWF